MTLPKRKKINICENENLYNESQKLLTIEKNLCKKLKSLEFTSSVEYVYNPLEYAKELHEAFVKNYFEKSKKKILFLGINPGPWGMCQTGIAFGEINYVKYWLKITGLVGKPSKEHPKKKVTGLDCHRSEISGKKFWGFFKILCGTPENFFKHSFVYNLCPFAFIDASGKNITPPEIKSITAKKLIDICDEAFINIIKDFNFEIVIGIGKFAEKRAKKALKLAELPSVKVYSIPHPSPRNAQNFSNWEQATLMALKNNNLIEYFIEDKPLNVNLFKK